MKNSAKKMPTGRNWMEKKLLDMLETVGIPLTEYIEIKNYMRRFMSERERNATPDFGDICFSGVCQDPQKTSEEDLEDKEMIQCICGYFSSYFSSRQGGYFQSYFNSYSGAWPGSYFESRQREQRFSSYFGSRQVEFFGSYFGSYSWEWFSSYFGSRQGELFSSYFSSHQGEFFSSYFSSHQGEFFSSYFSSHQGEFFSSYFSSHQREEFRTFFDRFIQQSTAAYFQSERSEHQSHTFHSCPRIEHKHCPDELHDFWERERQRKGLVDSRLDFGKITGRGGYGIRLIALE